MSVSAQLDRSAITARRTRVHDHRMDSIIGKVRAGERLTREDGLVLFDTPDIWTVCSLSELVRRRTHGDIAYYNINRHVNYSNICALSCKFCAFYRKKDQDGAYEFSLDQIRDEAIRAAEAGATELHIVGGLHPWLPLDYYLDMMRMIHEAAPRLHIKAFTAVEIVHLARLAGRGRDGVEGIKSVLRDLREAGLGSLPGGGAEVFDDRVHDEAYKGKIRAGKWLDVHRAAHELGINSNATMLYGHIESRADRVHHMILLREEQDRTLRDWARGQGIVSSEDAPIVLTGPDEMYPNDRLPHAAVLPPSSPKASSTSEQCASSFPRRRESSDARDALETSLDSRLRGNDTLRGNDERREAGEERAEICGYFQTIIPLPFFPDASELEHLPAPTGLENLRTLAICRLMLDNFPHVKAFWIMQTLEMAQFMLLNGADDIDGTVVWYDITKAVGEGTHQETTVWDLQRAIREAGFRPVERDTLYRRVIRNDGHDGWSVTPT